MEIDDRGQGDFTVDLQILSPGLRGRMAPNKNEVIAGYLMEPDIIAKPARHVKAETGTLRTE